MKRFHELFDKYSMDEAQDANIVILPPLTIICQVGAWLYYYFTEPDHSTTLGSALLEAILVSFSGIVVAVVLVLCLIAVEALLDKKSFGTMYVILGVIGTILLFLRLKE